MIIMSEQAAAGAAPVITIDGPSGSGKGTVSQALARHLRWHFLDSGALYRLVALAGREAGVSADEPDELARLAATLDVVFAPSDALEAEVHLAGVDVSRAIRDEAIGVMASRVAALGAVREALLERQRRFAEAPGLVADGRDMGTVVFPAAPLKVFLTASAQERAERRCKQLKDKGESVNLAQILADIKARDERDSQRAVAPLKPAPDALVIDSTHLSIAEVQQRILDAAQARGLV
jgi:cytidylate kinase